MEFAPALVMCT